MKNHPFFFGVDWNTIRQIDAPFVPSLRSVTDTSYFPTDELDQVSEEPATGDSGGANKDLAFLGYVFLLLWESPPKWVYLPVIPSSGSRSPLLPSNPTSFYIHYSWSVLDCLIPIYTISVTLVGCRLQQLNGRALFTTFHSKLSCTIGLILIW